MTHRGTGDGAGLVTGDAVVVDLRLAKLPSRAIAFLIDLVLQVGALVALTFLLGATSGLADDVLAVVFVFVGTIAVVVGYPVAMETLTRGRTVGKLALGLRVVRDDGGAIRFRHALARGLMAVVEIYLCFGAIAVITSLLSPEGKRVGDYLAGTVVVRERAPTSPTAQWWLPPSLQPWAASLDLTRLQPATALSARQFLVRAASLNDGARDALGRAIADDMLRQVSPPPPPGVGPEIFLNAVLAERSRRATIAGAPASGSPAIEAPPPAVSTPEISTTSGEAPPEENAGGFSAPS
ncbi:MAG: RDD family protein [Actinomycetes bacterium]